MKNSLNLEQLNLCNLKETRDWYLQCLEPLVNEKSFEEAKENIDKFIEKDGIKLQEKLENYKKEIFPDSWLMPYSKDIYLYGRGPVAVEGNYLLETLPYPKDIDYLNFVTRIVLSIQDLYHDLVNKQIPQMTFKDQLLCMKQLKGFLRGTRVFNLNHDDYNIYQDYQEVNSCAIFYKNSCYIVKLFESDGTKIAGELIYKQIKTIYDNAKQADVSFTCLAFNNHNDSYEMLLKNAENQKELEKINKAICCISLNDKKGSEVTTNQKTYYDGTNAWPLKSWSIEIFQDLVCTFNNEHTFVDGATCCNLVSDLFAKVDLHDEIFNSTDESIEQLEEFNLSFDESKLKEIKENYQEYIKQFDSIRFEFANLNIGKIRENKINIDAVFQLGFLYADYYSFDELKTIHESVSAAHFYDGRTSMLKSISNEGIAFIKALAESSNSKEIMDLLKEASQKHIEGVKKAKDFCSIERHYAGLNLFSNGKLTIFQDPGFIKHSTQEICTSSMGNTRLINRFAFAPVAKNGLGIGYLSQGNKFAADISYYKEDSAKVMMFNKKLEEYYKKINELLEKDV